MWLPIIVLVATAFVILAGRAPLIGPHDRLRTLEVRRANVSFYVGDLHHSWCLTSETEQVELFERELSTKNGQCVVIDVGMNDGFYTNMAGAYKCHVYAFELQKRCISLAQMAVKQNGNENMTHIYNAPVTSRNGETVILSFPKDELCDGGFTISGKEKEERTHSHQQLTTNRSFTSVSLDSFVPTSTFVDILKIDVEGHETEVLEGSLRLFREHRLGQVVVELGPEESYNNFTALLDVYHTIMSYNYSLTTFNCKPGRGAADTFKLNNFNEFVKYAGMSIYNRWRCGDLRIVRIV